MLTGFLNQNLEGLKYPVEVVESHMHFKSNSSVTVTFAKKDQIERSYLSTNGPFDSIGDRA